MNLFGQTRVPDGAMTDGNGKIRPEWREFFESLASSSPGSGASDLIMGSAPARKTAEYLVADTSSVAWDMSTAGQPKPYVPINGIDTEKLQDESVTSDKIAPGAVTPAQLAPIPTDTLLGRDTAGTGDVELISAVNGLEFTGSQGLGIANAGVTNARMANMAQATIKGRAAGAGTGAPTDLSDTQAASVIALATETQQGVVEMATDAEIRAATTGAKAIMAEDLETASAAVALTDASTVAVDWDTGINFSLTVTANRTIGNPTNGQPGTWRTIRVQGNNSTDRAITFGNQYLGEVPTITTCDDTRWFLLMIFCITTTHFVVSSKRALGSA